MARPRTNSFPEDDYYSTKESSFRTSLGIIISKLRSERGLSQRLLAYKLHMSPSKFCNFELGKKDIEIFQFYCLCRELNIDANSLLYMQTPQDQEEMDASFIALYKSLPEADKKSLYEIMLKFKAAQKLV